MLTKKRGEEIAKEVQTAMKPWQIEARRIGIPQRDIDIFALLINKWL